jgi:preprotein translocase subunit SecD
MTNLKWRSLIILGITLVSIFGLIARPSLPSSFSEVRSNFAERIKLGLDLRGGSHMILEVVVEEAVSFETDQTQDRLTAQMRDRAIGFEDVRKLDSTSFLVRSLPPAQLGDFRRLVEEFFPEWDTSSAPGEPNSMVVTMRTPRVNQLRTDTLRQAVETIRRRIDALGLSEPTIAEHGRAENEILVQLPGVGDPARAKEVIQAGGQLELRLVHDDRTWLSQAEALAAFGGVLPPNTELVPGRADRRRDDPLAPDQVWYLLARTSAVTGRDLRSTSVGLSDRTPGMNVVNFNLTREGAQRFGPFTAANVGRQMAIVLEGKVQSAPVIQSRIDDSGQIYEFTRAEAENLSLVLRSGALPATIRYLEERTVGPSLGADSIRQGSQASILGLIAVTVFMVVYYRLAGVNAVVALALNLLILLAALAYFGAVLTLPGIAGIILVIGMGVDSNVLVFERIREELRAGKVPASAVDSGFGRAILTIVDANVTTIVACFFLFMFGTGPVRGFAITLVLGLLANLFTSIFVSKTLFGWYLTRMSRQDALSI